MAMSIEDIRQAFVKHGRGDLKLSRARIRYPPGGKQILQFTGWHSDGTPFAVQSAPFKGCPVQRTGEMASDLVRLHQGWPASPQTSEAFMAGVDLQIRGLSDIVKRAREGIAQARSSTDKVGVSAKALASSADAIAKQIDQAREDIEFEATTLGNGGQESSQQSDAAQKQQEGKV